MKLIKNVFIKGVNVITGFTFHIRKCQTKWHLNICKLKHALLKWLTTGFLLLQYA